MKPIAFTLISLLLSCHALAQDETPTADVVDTADVTDAVHDQLRALRDRMFAAYEKRDVDKLLQDVAPNVVITWQNADRNEGRDEFLSFYKRMMNGDDSVVKDVSTKFEVDDLSVMYGDDTAIARGSQQDRFSLNDGSEFTLLSRWTATVVKQEGVWNVARFHVSSNIFDNPILETAKGWLMKAGLIGGLLGLIAGLVLGRMTKRQPAAE